MKSNKVYFENLDGLRFIAFLSVFLAHSFYSEQASIMDDQLVITLRAIFGKGTLGVNFFFVLSGFLITYLLEIEQREKGSINIKHFYVRRVLRIWPLFYLIVFVGFVIIPKAMVMIGEPREETANIIYYLFFINNFDAPPSSAVLGVLWSIAIEEQFYLVWPLLMAVWGKRDKNLLFISIIATSFIWRYIGNGSYTDTLTCINDMALGGWMAYLIINHDSFKQFVASWNRPSILLIYALGFTFIYVTKWWTSLGYLAIASHRLILSLFFVFVILEQNYAKGSLFKMSSIRIFTKWGTYTYGLYMLHFVSIYLIGKSIRLLIPTSTFHVVVTETVGTFIFSLIMAYFSYRLFEKPFLKLKDRFSQF